MELFNDWLWWIFDHLPFTHVVRILDCYLVEGYKIFYRIAFALVRTFVKYIRSGNSKWNGLIDSRGVKGAFIYFCKEIPVSCTFTVWKFHDFFITQILREINRSTKSAILTNSEPLELQKVCF